LEKRLAILLIDQWDLPKDSPNLRTPKPISTPDLSSLKRFKAVQGGALPIKVYVDPIGFVKKLRFVHPMKNQDIQNAISEEIMRTPFCPAFVDGKFSKGWGIVLLNIDVR
jgi:hypothetical protein